MKPNENQDIIELNVGGFSYTTSRTTVMSCPDSMLARMISGLMSTATDTNGRIFIDRDGPLFRYILNFLRDKRLNLPDNFDEYAQLRQEADFYRIESIINEIDCVFYQKPCLKNNQRSPSITSLLSNAMSSSSNKYCGSINDATQIYLPPDIIAPFQVNSANDTSNHSQGIYFTIVSKLYQGTVESIIGSLKILNVLSTLDSNSKRFLRTLLQRNQVSRSESLQRSANLYANLGPERSSSNSRLRANNHSQNTPLITDSFICECKIMEEERLICCKPCGLNTSNDNSMVNLSQTVIKMAKRYGVSTGYWEDHVYLPFESTIPNREQLSSILTAKYKAKLLNSSVCDRGSSYEENSKSILVERWFLSNLDLTRNE